MIHKIKSNKIKPIHSYLLILVFVLPLFSFSLHKEYYSLTKIDYNKKERALQITLKLFTDDISLTLNKQYDKNLELGTQIEKENTDKLLELYLKEKFVLSVNGKEKKFHFLGKEFEKDAMFVYLEIKNIDNIQNIELMNSILQEEFPEQENIVKLNVNEQRKSLFLTKEKDKALLKF